MKTRVSLKYFVSYCRLLNNPFTSCFLINLAFLVLHIAHSDNINFYSTIYSFRLLNNPFTSCFLINLAFLVLHIAHSENINFYSTIYSF